MMIYQHLTRSYIKFKDKIKIYQDPILDGKQEWRNDIKVFKRRNIKNLERIMTIHPSTNVFFYPILTLLLYMPKEYLQFELNLLVQQFL